MTDTGYPSRMRRRFFVMEVDSSLDDVEEAALARKIETSARLAKALPKEVVPIAARFEAPPPRPGAELRRGLEAVRARMTARAIPSPEAAALGQEKGAFYDLGFVKGMEAAFEELARLVS